MDAGSLVKEPVGVGCGTSLADADAVPVSEAVPGVKTGGVPTTAEPVVGNGIELAGVGTAEGSIVDDE
jgi:hypothetical protein